MLAFESYSKTSFEIIIKERIRAFLFRQMALQVPRFILEGKLKKGVRSTFEKFIDDEKWLGECVVPPKEGTPEYEKDLQNWMKWKKVEKEFAEQRNLYRDSKKLYNFYKAISRAFGHAGGWGAAATEPGIAPQMAADYADVEAALKELAKMKKPQDGMNNTAWKKILAVYGADDVKAWKKTEAEPGLPTCKNIYKRYNSATKKKEDLEWLGNMAPNGEAIATLAQPKAGANKAVSAGDVKVVGKNAWRFIAPLRTGGNADSRYDLFFHHNCTRAYVSKTSKTGIPVGTTAYSGPLPAKNEPIDLVWQDTAFVDASAAGDHFRGDLPWDSFSDNITPPAKPYGGNDFQDYPMGKCRPFVTTDNPSWETALSKHIHDFNHCKNGYDSAGGSPASRIYQLMGTAWKLANADKQIKNSGWEVSAKNQAYDLAKGILEGNCLHAWWFLYQPDGLNSAGWSDKGGLFEFGKDLWGRGSLYYHLIGYNGWDSNTFNYESGYHQLRALQQHAQLAIVRCKDAYLHAIKTQHDKIEVKYLAKKGERADIALELGLDLSSFMGGLSSNAVQGVTYNTCELYIFAAFILATNFMGGSDCPVDFPYNEDEIREIGMKKLKEMFVDIFQDMAEKVLALAGGSVPAASIEYLQNTTNYNHSEFEEVVKKAFDNDAIVGDDAMPLTSLFDISTIGNSEQVYMEEELGDYVYVLDANLYQIIKPIK